MSTTECTVLFDDEKGERRSNDHSEQCRQVIIAQPWIFNGPTEDFTAAASPIYAEIRTNTVIYMMRPSELSVFTPVKPDHNKNDNSLRSRSEWVSTVSHT